ncbi:hypothetical protein GH714_028664 [Hevea brasiliensis]|uniref:Zinc finger-XS domain-containing protein n=1 Tax=Hevea brasiliensis TaxID=3981 RepID=A0A6A6LNI0_HEVBR|nr:hypothetical protein GH714_028664 [Hevea brasiliensis]
MEIRSESPLIFCEICRERKENNQLIKNGNCGHPFAWNTYKHFLSKDVLDLWEKALSVELVPNFTCRKELLVKTGSKNGKGKLLTARTTKKLSPLEVKKTVQFSQRVAGTNNSAGADSKQIVPERKTAAINVPNSFLLQPREVQSALHHRYNSHSVLSLSRGNEVPKSSYSCFKDMPPIFDDITPMPPRLNRQQSAASSPWKGSVDSQEKVADDVEKFETAFSGDTTAANEDDSDSDALPDTDDYDSEASPRSPESCKKSKWFKKFLEGLEYLSTEEINDPARQWHCPSCQGVAGAIKRYLGLQTLMKHAKTKGSRRLRLHRELAQLLEEKLHGSQATSAALGGEACGKWKGPKEEKKHHG